MKKIGVMLDKWKLKIFKKHLEAAGFSYKKHPGLTSDTLTLKIETDRLGDLQDVIEAAQNECARAHLH